MRSFYSVSFRQLRTRRLRVLLTATGIVLGVGMICGVLLLAATIQRTFTDLYDSIYGRTDLVVSGGESTGSLPRSALERARRTAGVEDASGDVFAVLSLVGENGKVEDSSSTQLNAVGIDPAAADYTDSENVDGRDVRSGHEIQVESSWADANGIDVGEKVRLAAPSGIVSLRVVGTFQFSSGLDFGGEGFANIPLGIARRAFDKPDVWDEIEVVVAGDDEGGVERVKRRLEAEFGKGVEVDTPEAKGEEIQDQLQALNVVLYFFAGDGPVRRRLSDLQQLQHDRASSACGRSACSARSERGRCDDRPLGARSRPSLLGVIGAAIGSASASCLRSA